MTKYSILAIFLLFHLTVLGQVRLNSIGAEVGMGNMSASTSSIFSLYTGLSLDFGLTNQCNSGIRLKGLLLQNVSLYTKSSNNSITKSSIVGLMVGYYSNQEIYHNLQLEGVSSVTCLKDNILQQSNNIGFGVSLTAGIFYKINTDTDNSRAVKLGVYEDYTTTFTTTKPEYSSTYFRAEYQF